MCVCQVLSPGAEDCPYPSASPASPHTPWPSRSLLPALWDTPGQKAEARDTCLKLGPAEGEARPAETSALATLRSEGVQDQLGLQTRPLPAALEPTPSR